MQQPILIDEINEGLDQAVQPDPWVQMPLRVYSDEREFYFDQLARVHEIRPLELRVALSNIWCIMTMRRGRRA